MEWGYIEVLMKSLICGEWWNVGIFVNFEFIVDIFECVVYWLVIMLWRNKKGGGFYELLYVYGL